MIKQKLQSAWNWTKKKVKKFKKWIIAFLIPVALAAPLVIEPILYPVGKITAPENNGYFLGVLNYDAVLASDITDDQPLKYQLDDKFISFKPIEMRWDNNKFKDIKPQKAKINKKNYLYEDAFGGGIDIDMNFGERVFEKIVKIESLADLGKIPDGAEYLEIEFKVKTNFVVDGWNKKDKFEITDKVRLGDFSYIEPVMVWDSYNETICSDEEICEDECDVGCIVNSDECDICECEISEICESFNNKIQIESYLESGRLVKRIPIKWLKTAQFPIYTDTDIAYGTALEFESGTTEWGEVIDIDTNKFVVCYMDGSDAYAGKCVAGSVSGTTITLGNILEFDSDIRVGGIEYLDVAKLDTDKFVVCYIDDSDDDLTCRATTVSGETIAAYGATHQPTNSDWEYISNTQIGTDKFITCGNNEGGFDDGHCVVSSVSTTTISSGSIKEFSTIKPSYADVCKLDTDKFAVVWRNFSGSAFVKAATISTLTISEYGSAATITTGGGYVDCAQMDTDKMLAVANSTDFDGFINVATFSGTAVTIGTAREFNTTNAFSFSVASLTDQLYVVSYDDHEDGSYQGRSIYGTAVDWDNRTSTNNTEEFFEAGGVDWTSTATINTTKVVICFQDDDDSDKGHCIIGDTPSAAAARRIFIVD